MMQKGGAAIVFVFLTPAKRKGSEEVKNFRRIIIFTFIGIWLLLQTNVSIAQGSYSTLIGTVKGIHGWRWLDVESEKDKNIYNFRIGRKTVYTPQRHPNVGEKVKVEYLTHRGIYVAYTVTILEPQAEGPKESPK